MKTIYISSTFKDLQKEREAAATAIQRLGHHPICMEYYVASDERPVDKCIHDAETCDIYVGIFAFRYGFIPAGYDKSITHLEYEAAVKAHKPCLIFFVDPEAPFPPKFVADGEERQKINQLRDELGKHLLSSFKTPEELGGLVSAAVSNTLLSKKNPAHEKDHFPKIPGYRIEGKLGKGGMGTVYLGVHEKLKQMRAIKVLNPWLVEDKHFANQFLREAKIAASLINPHIITIYDMGQEGSQYYIVMELLKGGSLKDKIQQGPLAPSVALAYLRQMSVALCLAHQKGVIHRDIKSDNIMFRHDGTAILTDFGIARSIDVTTLLTQAEYIGCTPKYMSPEQAKGEAIDFRSDIYSLGIVFYEMLVGSVPYDGTNWTAIGIKHIQSPVPALPTHLSKYQPLLAKMLAKDPDQRFLSADALQKKIDGLIAGEDDSVPNNPSVLMVKGVPYEMVEIPGGVFQMGATNGGEDERPVHTVRVSGFRMGKTAVTQGFWQAVMGDNPSRFKNGDNYPVENVSWEDCQAFLKKLNQITGGTYRLPTEAQWEYACRAGTTGDYYGKIENIAWYEENAHGSTHPVGLKQPNAFGLYDMLGNVWEWCQDWYGPYNNSNQTDPTGPTTGEYRVCRGGSWFTYGGYVRSAFRFRYTPVNRYDDLGFRFFQVISSPASKQR